MVSVRGLKKRIRAVLPPRRVMIGGLTVEVREGDIAADLLARWAPDWKTRLIARVMAKREGVFLDVGANVGQTLVDYAATGRRSGYFGFEPNPRCVEHLQRIVRDNGVEFTIVPAGLSDANKIERLYLMRGTSVDSSATLLRELRPARPLSSEVIACFRLDDIYRDLVHDAPLALVKVDVEGAELYTFRGMQEFCGESGPGSSAKCSDAILKPSQQVIPRGSKSC